MELGLTADTRRVVPTSVLIEAASAAGFTALGLVAGQSDPDTASRLDGSGLVCHELLGLQVGEDLEAAEAMAARLADDAAMTGARWVLTTFQIGLSSRVAEAVGRWAAMFDAAGSGLAVEFSPLGPVATIGDARAVLTAAGDARVGMIIDSWNFCFGPSTWDELEQVPLELIAHLQFTDALAPVGAPTMEEAMTRRALPGDGVLELDRFVATLRGRGWDGLVSMQVLSDDLRRLPIEEYARRVRRAGARYWA